MITYIFPIASCNPFIDGAGFYIFPNVKMFNITKVEIYANAFLWMKETPEQSPGEHKKQIFTFPQFPGHSTIGITRDTYAMPVTTVDRKIASGI